MKKQLRSYLIILGILLTGGSSFAQRADFANPERSFKRLYSKIIGQNEKGFFILRSSNSFNNKIEQLRLRDNRIELAYMENNLSVKWHFPVQLPDAYGEIQDILFISDSLYIFYSSINKEKSTNDLYCVRVNTQKGELYKDPVKIDEITFDKKRNRGVFYIKKSKDNKMFFSMYKQPSPDSEKLVFNIKVFDASFTNLWEQRYATEYYDGILLLNDYVLSNDSSVVLLTSFELDKRSLKDKKFTMIRAMKDQPHLEVTPLSLSRYFITDLKFAIDYINNKIVFGGLYSEANSYSSAGIAYITFDLATKEVTRATESFKAKFLNEFSSERTINRGTELINYNVDRIILRTDGGMLLIAESNYVTESTNYNSYYQLYTTSYTYHYDNVLVFSVNNDGKIHWENIIRKNQVSEDDGAFYSSYIVSLDIDKVHFVYNKFIRKSTDIVSHTINNFGESSEKVVVKEADNVMIMPGGGKQISADQLIVPCVQKNKTNFIRLSF